MTDEQLIQEYLETCPSHIDEEAVREYAADVGGAEYLDSFEEAYAGQWDSERDFAEELVEDLGMLDSMEASLRFYFDYDAFARDLFCGDYFMTDSGHVFRSM